MTRSICFNFRWAAFHAVFGMRRAALLLTLPNKSRVASSANDRITEADYTIPVYRVNAGAFRMPDASRGPLEAIHGAQPAPELVPIRGNWGRQTRDTTAAGRVIELEAEDEIDALFAHL